MTLNVAKFPLPVSAIEALTDHAPKIHAALMAGVSSQEIIADMEPVALAGLNYVAGLLLPPPLGTALGIIEWALAHRQAWTPEEQQAWWDRAQGTP